MRKRRHQNEWEYWSSRLYSKPSFRVFLARIQSGYPWERAVRNDPPRQRIHPSVVKASWRECTHCGHFLPWREFSRDARSKTGRKHICRVCDAKIGRERESPRRYRESIRSAIVETIYAVWRRHPVIRRNRTIFANCGKSLDRKDIRQSKIDLLVSMGYDRKWLEKILGRGERQKNKVFQKKDCFS